LPDAYVGADSHYGKHLVESHTFERNYPFYEPMLTLILKFNAALSEPITKRLATSWEKTFQNNIPKALEIYTNRCSRILETFHGKIEGRAHERDVGLAQLQLLANVTQTNAQLFEQIRIELYENVTALQKDASREFNPIIVSTMSPAYDLCANESGRGSWMRMKSHMSTHVCNSRTRMFQLAAESVKSHLRELCRELENLMDKKKAAVFYDMRKNYWETLVGTKRDHDHVSLPMERTMKAEVLELLLKVDAQFDGLARGELGNWVDVGIIDRLDVEGKDRYQLDGDFEVLYGFEPEERDKDGGEDLTDEREIKDDESDVIMMPPSPAQQHDA
jgi:hypothetical protein